MNRSSKNLSRKERGFGRGDHASSLSFRGRQTVLEFFQKRIGESRNLNAGAMDHLFSGESPLRVRASLSGRHDKMFALKRCLVRRGRFEDHRVLPLGVE